MRPPLAAGLLLCSCTKAGQTVATHYLRIADGSGDIPTLNPHLFTEAPIGYIAEMTQAYLVKYDAQNQPYPELLTSVPTQANGGISKDGDTITWHLRKGVRWSDGAPFTADDRRLLHARRPQPGEQRGRAGRLEPHHQDRRTRQIYRRLSPATSVRLVRADVLRQCRRESDRAAQASLGRPPEYQSRAV